jgi:hypothetical protein
MLNCQSENFTVNMYNCDLTEQDDCRESQLKKAEVLDVG